MRDMQGKRTLIAVVGTWLVTNAFNLSVAAGWFTNTPDVVLWSLWLLSIAVWVAWIVTHPTHNKLSSWARRKPMAIGLGFYLVIGAAAGAVGGGTLYVLRVASKRNAPSQEGARDSAGSSTVPTADHSAPPYAAISPLLVKYESAFVNDTFRFRIKNVTDDDIYSVGVTLRETTGNLKRQDFEIDVPPSSRKPIGDTGSAARFADMGGLLGQDVDGHAFFYIFINKMTVGDMREIVLKRLKLKTAVVEARVAHASRIQTPLVIDANGGKFPFQLPEKITLEAMLTIILPGQHEGHAEVAKHHGNNASTELQRELRGLAKELDAFGTGRIQVMTPGTHAQIVKNNDEIATDSFDMFCSKYSVRLGAAITRLRKAGFERLEMTDAEANWVTRCSQRQWAAKPDQRIKMQPEDITRLADELRNWAAAVE